MIPVIYIHFGDVPKHLERSLTQSLKYNTLVYLITDSDITLSGITVFNIKQYLNNVSVFESLYQHFSTNAENFEKICIKRWIILNNFLNEQNIDVCYYSDSDVMLYADVTKIYDNYRLFDACYTMPEIQEPYRWTASACCSYWKKETLDKFTQFILNIYSSNGISQLKEKWNYHLKNSISGGVCDMTLLYLFSKEINFYSLSKEKEGVAFDQNNLDNENYFKNEYELVSNKAIKRGVKKIIWKNGLPMAYNLVLKKEIRFVALTEYARYVDAKYNVISDIRMFLYKIKSKLK